MFLNTTVSDKKEKHLDQSFINVSMSNQPLNTILGDEIGT